MPHPTEPTALTPPPTGNGPNSQALSEQAQAQMAATGWYQAVLMAAAHYQCNVSPEHIRLAAQWQGQASIDVRARDMARQAGLSLQMVQPKLDGLTPWRLPVIVELAGGQVALITHLHDDQLTLAMCGDGGSETVHQLADLQPHMVRLAVVRPLQNIRDARVDAYVAPVEKSWLRDLVLVDWRPYAHIMVASLITNLMALGGVIFSMQVYDRVVPAQSMPTLYVLFGGVMLSLVFAYVMRDARMRITDILGKRADLRISDRVFGHALRVKNSARPNSTGTFISQIRELESVRDMLTSVTIAAAADLPFFLLFCVVFWYISGWLVLVPVLAFVLLMLPSLLAQRRLGELAQLGMREGALRNAMLVEAVQGIEDIKILQAEHRFQNQWNHYNAVNANSSMASRQLLNRLNNWMQSVQGAAFAMVIFFGVPAAIAGDLSTGALVASSILISRMLAPLSSITMILNRWQQAKVAAQSLDQLMNLPIDSPAESRLVHRPMLRGDYVLKDASFGYDPQHAALSISSLTIKAGEKIALLGRNGAGKSTLLQALSGLLEPQSGSIMLDGVELGHIDPVDVRRDVVMLTQNARLFHGSLRENLTFGMPMASDEQLIRALQISGALAFVQSLPAGLNHEIREGGLGLSGGQRQALLLARLLLREPHIALLDEPTTAMDDASERDLIAHLRQWPAHQSLIVATHRLAVLDLVDRIIVLDGGKIHLDGPKEQVLAALKGEKGQRGTAVPATAATAATAAPTSTDAVAPAAPGGEAMPMRVAKIVLPEAMRKAMRSPQ